MSTATRRATLTVPVSWARDHVVGPDDALVTLLEYGDYQCPHCRAAKFVVKAIMAQVGDNLRFAYRHFPITTIHPHAERAAEAAEAAGHQHRFWTMHDMLFDNQENLSGAALLSYAAAAGLDVNRFSNQLATHADLAKVGEDFVSGVRSGVNGTPTFFINGARHDGGWDYELLITAIQDAVAARAAVRAGG